ncbi:acetoacetate decarboxylase [Microbispora catharanthi]|uniref:3-hydroxyacyl-CoA dehydrogenase C-terminal domain-containing protein n=1 Tax=Microbispora catharanthi TaxID=1712871 RepID=A0A5N6C554_9ACTN|nr:acetoacetate decarboxylase [Microbispora catharanthi]KAB8187862.1 hypothetical protein FH610_001450 [Microbispora catharanthi]
MSGGVGGRRATCDPLTAFSTPVHAPAYAPPPYKFTDREYFRIVHRTDLDAVRGVVPQPLTVVDPVVRFEVIRMPDSTGFGSYHECGQIAIVDHDGRQADFNIGLYVDSVSAIVGGRELGGYPKTGGTPRLYLDSDTLVATLDYGTLRTSPGHSGRGCGRGAGERSRTPRHQARVVGGDRGGGATPCATAQLELGDSGHRDGGTHARAGAAFDRHPFNPPHLVPLVEIVPGGHTDPAVVERASRFYRGLGKRPQVLAKEVPGFVANRLQAALFREAIHLVTEGVVTEQELDDIVTGSIGMRWAAAGPFRTFHLGGGPGGLPAFFRHLGGALEEWWGQLGTPHLDGPTVALLNEQAQNFGGGVAELAAERDAAQIAVMRVLGELPGPAREGEKERFR